MQSAKDVANSTASLVKAIKVGVTLVLLGILGCRALMLPKESWNCVAR